MPAILKGWIDRVFCSGFAIGVPRADGHGWKRYGVGPLAGKRAMLAVTTGSKAEHMGPRGIHGPIADLLFPINHGLLHYAGATVIEPVLIHSAARMSPAQADAAAKRYAERLLGIERAPVLAYRNEHDGGFERGVMTDDATPGSGFGIHLPHAKGSAGEEPL